MQQLIEDIRDAIAHTQERMARPVDHDLTLMYPLHYGGGAKNALKGLFIKGIYLIVSEFGDYYLTV